MPNQELFYEDVEVGAELPALVKHPSRVQIFRFSAATRNTHLIHYSREYAASEGYPDVLVQSHLHGCFLAQSVMDWGGPRARLLGFRWQNRGMAVPGDVLTCTGKVTSKEIAGDLACVECDLEERNQKGELCAPGWARIALPRRA